MMGKDFDDLANIKPEGSGDKSKEPLVIDAKGLSHAGTIKPFDLEIHKGEVIGLTGLLGSGRSELARAIYGADRAQTGTLKVKEQEVTIREQEKAIRDNNEFMIDALGSVVEFRSIETGDHVKRIKYLTRILLKYLAKYFPKYGVTPTQIDQIARASALHDIGKIGIPDSILLKPGKLTTEEFEVMKTHTTIGCEILESFKSPYTDDFYQYCYEICRYHHERADGRGYPDHLSGDEIPISAQIVSIADVYEALVSERVYKSAYSNDEAYQMILNGECGQFSEDVLECFKLAKEDFFNLVEVINMFNFTT